jgi:hypothetical protein
MSKVGEWPRSDEKYRALLQCVNEVVDISRRLPEAPFFPELSNVDICQFSHAIEGSFEPVLKVLVDFHEDGSVFLVTIDPAPSVYRQNYGTYGAFSILGQSVTENYWETMARQSTGELLFSANTIAIAGDLERYSRGLSVELEVGHHVDHAW